MSDATRVHEDELVIADEVVRRLVDEQFPRWRPAAIRRLAPTGTDNQVFRLGADLVIRMPRIGWAATAAEREFAWSAGSGEHPSRTRVGARRWRRWMRCSRRGPTASPG